MKISIVTPVLNDTRVARALDSIIAQQHEHEVELIVIDGGSRDDTLDVLEAYRDRITVMVSEPDGGIYHAMNKGIGKATGEVIGILNADDRYSDVFVLRDVMEIFGDEKVDACYGDSVHMTETGRIIRRQRTGLSRRWAWRLGWMPTHPAFFLRKRVYDRFGPFELGFRIAADYELMLRVVLKHGIETRCLRRVLVNMAPGGFANRSMATVLKAALEVSRAWQCNGLGYGNGLLAAAMKLARKPAQFVPFPPSRSFLAKKGQSSDS